MRKTSRWHQAVILSCIVNFCLLLAVGWVTSCLYANANAYETPLIEVELLSIADQASPALAAWPDTPAAAQEQMINPTVPSAVADSSATLQPQVTGVTVNDHSFASSPGGASTLAAVGGAGGANSGGGAASSSSAAGGGGGQLGRILPPRVINKVEPDYPEAARRQGIEGVVRVRIEITEQGRVGSVSVSGSSGSELLDEAAVKAVRKWRFAPARDEFSGMAVACTTSLSVAFDLN